MDFMIEYRIKPEMKEQAEKIREDFFTELKSLNDPDFSYRSLCKPDGVTFVHLGWFSGQEALARFQGLPGFKDFAAGLKEVAEAPPAATELTEMNTSKG